MLLTGRFRRVSLWLWSTPTRGPMQVFVRPDRPALVERMQRLFAEDSGEVEVMLDRRRRERRSAAAAFEPERRRADRRRPRVPRRVPGAAVAIGHTSRPGLDYTPLNRTKGEDRMMSVESKQMRDGDEVRRWLEAGQTQLASLLELLHEHDRLRERVEASERENERLRGVTYENEQLRNRLETSERQAEHLRQSMSELRGENERHQKEREDAAERLNHLVNEIAQRLRPVRVAPPIFVRSLARGARQRAGMRASSAVLRAGSRWHSRCTHHQAGGPAQNFLYERTRDRDRREASRAPRGRRGGSAHELARLARSRVPDLERGERRSGGRGAAALPARPGAPRREAPAQHERARHAPVHQELRRADRGRDDHRLRLPRDPQRGFASRGVRLPDQALPAPGPGPRGERCPGPTQRPGRPGVTEYIRSLTEAHGAVRISRYVLSLGRGPAGIRTSCLSPGGRHP